MRSRQSAWLTRWLGRETVQDLRGSVFLSTQQEKVLDSLTPWKMVGQPPKLM